jgi:hypothetical protein
MAKEILGQIEAKTEKVVHGKDKLGCGQTINCCNCSREGIGKNRRNPI